MTCECAVDPVSISEQRRGLAYNRARLTIRGRPVVPFGIRNGALHDLSDCFARCSRQFVAGAEDLLRLTRRPHHAGLRQFRERIAQSLRIGFISAVRRPLETERIFDALLRLVGTYHPGAGAAIILVFRGLADARAAAHFSDTAARRAFRIRRVSVVRA